MTNSQKSSRFNNKTLTDSQKINNFSSNKVMSDSQKIKLNIMTNSQKSNRICNKSEQGQLSTDMKCETEAPESRQPKRPDQEATKPRVAV